MAEMVLMAGVAWFAVIFACGFLLGPVRMFLLQPRFGAAVAVAIEAVPMLAAMWLIAPRVAGLFAVPATIGPRLAMGGLGLVLVVLAETLLGWLLRGQGPGAWAERFTTAEGQIYLALLLAFALMPALRRG